MFKLSANSYYFVPNLSTKINEPKNVRKKLLLNYSIIEVLRSCSSKILKAYLDNKNIKGESQIGLTYTLVYMEA